MAEQQVNQNASLSPNKKTVTSKDGSDSLAQQQTAILKDLNDMNKKTDELEQRVNGTKTEDESKTVEDKLKSSLQSRRDKGVLQNKNILKNKGMANSLQANAQLLEQQQTKDKLKKGIKERSDADKLYDSGITGIKGVASSLQATAKSLEKQQKVNKLKQWQEVEEVEEHDLYEAGIKQYKGMAHSLQGTAKQLEKGIKTDTLSKQMTKRTDENVLYDSGIKSNKGMAHSLQANAKQLSQQQTKDKLKKGIEGRSDADRVYDSGIGGIKGVASSLQATAKSLDKQKKIDKLKQWQEVDEVDEDILYESGIKKHKGMADSLHPAAESLEKGIKKDAVSKQLGKRRDEDVLYESGIKKNKGMAGALQESAGKLKHKQTTDKLKRKIRDRSDSDQFYDSGIAPIKGVANKLQAVAKTLEKQKKIDKLKQWQEIDDVEEEDLYEAGIKKYKGMAAALQPSAGLLQIEQKKDTLRKHMRNQADPKELESRGILVGVRYDDADLEQETQNIISSLTEDELHALRATLEQDIQNKNETIDPSIYVYLTGVIGSSLDKDYFEVYPEGPDTRQIVKRIFKDHDEKKELDEKESRERAIERSPNVFGIEDKTKGLEARLGNRPDLQQLEQQNILKAGGIVGSTLHERSDRLKQQQIRDRVKKGLRDRSDSWELADRGILQNKGVAPTLRGTAAKLQKQQRQDRLRAGLDKRSTAKDLEDKGIIFSSNIASSLQPNAAMLSSQLTAVKVLQRETLQQKGTIHRLYEIIQRKDEEINAMNDLSNKQNILIKNLKTIELEDMKMDADLRRCCAILEGINTEIAAFEVNCNKVMIDKIGNSNADELVDPHSMFNNKLDKYSEIVTSIGVCSARFTKSIDNIKEYINTKFVPNITNYNEWNLNEIMLWMKSLENGRYIKHFDKLLFGFKESEIFNGELLPDLSTADLSVTPFSIKSFKDKRDLVNHFKSLRIETETEEKEEEEEDNTPNDDQPRLIGHRTNEVVQNLMTNEKQNMYNLLYDDKEEKIKNLTEEEEQELYGEYYLIRRDILSILNDATHDDGSWGPIFVRLAWHSSGTFDIGDGSGGCNGASMRFVPEINDPENAGLHLARNKLEAIKQVYGDKISYADLWVFASYVAIEAMGGPYIKFVGGRKDKKSKSLCPANGRLPSAEGDSSHVRSVFYRMGFNDQEIVALIGGGHVLGRCHRDRSGYDGPWVDNPTQFSNEFFEELFENEWQQKEIKETGKIQFKDAQDELMMLPSDMLLMNDLKFRKWSQIYYKDKNRFFIHFANAYKKLTELGCELQQQKVNKNIQEQYVD